MLKIQEKIMFCLEESCCPMLHKFLKGDILQSRNVITKYCWENYDGTYYYLSGQNRLQNGEYHTFKAGWYDCNLKYISSITEDEREKISSLLQNNCTKEFIYQ